MSQPKISNAKWIFSLVLILLNAFNANAQLYQPGYYIGLWEPADEHKYDIKRLITQTDSGYVVTDYRKNSKLKFEGHFTSIDPAIEHGQFSFYGKKGGLEAEGNYHKGAMIGKWKFYDEKGIVMKEVDYDFVNKTCQTVDDPSKEIETRSIDSVRNEQKPVYPGKNENDVFLFIYEQLVFPPLAAMYYKSGTVIGKFIVDEQGYVCDIHTEGDVDEDLQLETKRVIALLSKWSPGSVNGNPVAVNFTFPIIFKFQ